jgi:hypothetical protein
MKMVLKEPWVNQHLHWYLGKNLKTPNAFEVSTKLNPTFELLDLSNTPLSKKLYFFLGGQNGGTQSSENY